jgi:hypothetical protein
MPTYVVFVFAVVLVVLVTEPTGLLLGSSILVDHSDPCNERLGRHVKSRTDLMLVDPKVIVQPPYKRSSRPKA